MNHLSSSLHFKILIFTCINISGEASIRSFTQNMLQESGIHVNKNCMAITHAQLQSLIKDL